jgi:hypothetical protein
MGYHNCELCDEPTWGSTDHCPNSSNRDGNCKYWDGNDLCDDCTIKLVCDHCSLTGCDYCIDQHCDMCKANICHACDDDGESEDDEQQQVAEVTFPLCEHTSCNAYLKMGTELNYCRTCTTAKNQRE